MLTVIFLNLLGSHGGVKPLVDEKLLVPVLQQGPAVGLQLTGHVLLLLRELGLGYVKEDQVGCPGVDVLHRDP